MCSDAFDVIVLSNLGLIPSSHTEAGWGPWNKAQCIRYRRLHCTTTVLHSPFVSQARPFPFCMRSADRFQYAARGRCSGTERAWLVRLFQTLNATILNRVWCGGFGNEIYSPVAISLNALLYAVLRLGCKRQKKKKKKNHE